ncbi:hypothetical protein ACOSQ4_028175 [Xanthoceras sorbifolium]
MEAMVRGSHSSIIRGANPQDLCNPKALERGKDIAEGNSRGKAKEVRKLSREEVQDYIKKGLCFKCGEKWAMGYQCPKGRSSRFLNSMSSSRTPPKKGSSLVMKGNYGQRNPILIRVWSSNPLMPFWGHLGHPP